MVSPDFVLKKLTTKVIPDASHFSFPLRRVMQFLLLYSQKNPGFLFQGDGNLAAFQGSLVNRKIARYYAREFKLCWHVNPPVAFRLLSQLKMILKIDRAVTSGVDVQASHPKGSFGKSGISIVESALADDCASPHQVAACISRVQVYSMPFVNLVCTHCRTDFPRVLKLLCSN
jgi:hypothetical protein